ncbi:uncharacterized protein B0P05DRAFT_584057 [Gilbertella persicaria]|uniref:Uncharacterized protein n=1 Tax=Rhizopus stolonifer TaxID=4846 RepID=A0A367KIZ6_RHIST|nr:uncharacterized protein B0P05DRAFT_584057 [Gilbertella persicaria]KAI8090939.1 hypothetical protein B0P05DRAFT_584057 [Gilbertella persicaria]RCI02120.1 hypothetical protein CU098_009364 [Rhizopus stolonifer]
MPITITLALGYLTIPFIIKSSTRALTTEEEEESELGTPRWTFSNTISITCFVQSPPTIYPTLEKHVIQLAPEANTFEQETLATLSSALHQHAKKQHGLITLTDDLLGILSPTDQPKIFVLQIVQFNTAHVVNTKSYASTLLPDLESSAKPVEIMELCQLWPNSSSQLIKIGSHIYKMACLYGYWDNWRVFEGICHRHQINPEQLVNIQR